jgi:anti-sigma-K factor RskA
MNLYMTVFIVIIVCAAWTVLTVAAAGVVLGIRVSEHLRRRRNERLYPTDEDMARAIAAWAPDLEDLP